MLNSFAASSELSIADIELIDSFVRGKKKSNAAAQLRIEHGDNAMKLLDRRGGLVAVSKQVNEWQQKVLLHNQAEEYMSVLCATLERNDFLAARKSRHPDFVEYSKYQTPMGYELHYQAAKIMSRAWLDHYAKPSGVQSRGLLVFHGGNWYPIQELKIDQRTMHLRTLVGNWTIAATDFIVWIEVASDQAVKPAIPKPSPLSSQPAPQATKSDSETTTMMTEGELLSDLTAAFKTPALPAVEQKKSTPDSLTKHDEIMTEMLSTTKARAIKRLLGYLKNGETVITTEVLKNGQGQIITTKTTEIKRSCPRWVIEKVQSMSDI
jgi:hypothetical protein